MQKLMLLAAIVGGSSALTLSGKSANGAQRRSRAVHMGGPSGLPRMPVAGWKHTKAFNPTMQYNERIATLYRDLEITLGTTEAPNERAALAAVRALPDLVNPAASSRWVFFRSKDLLVKKLGSEQAAILLLSRQPALMLHPQYDELSPALVDLLDPEELAAAKSSTGGGANSVLIAAASVAVGAMALVASGSL